MMSKETVCRTVPSQPNPPVVGKVTYHSVELSWLLSPRNSMQYSDECIYCIQEEDTEIGRGFVTVYEGADLTHIFTGLSSSTEYHYRVKCSNNIGSSQWSPIVTVSTTRHAVTSEHLHKAIQNNDLDMIRNIIEDNPTYLNVPDQTGASPLMAACRKGREKIVDLLLAFGANTEYRTTAGKTSLMEACYYGYNDCITLLQNAGASWLAEDQSGLLAIHWAVDGGNCETVEHILSSGVPVDSIGRCSTSQWTPLLKLAASNGSVSAARILIRHRADLNKRDSTGQTPLMYACLSGNVELVEVLLYNKANPGASTKYGQTALNFAMATDKEEIIELLKKATKRQDNSDN